MKKLKIYTTVLGSLLFLNSCKDGAEGDPGPKGDTGKDGTNGTANTVIGSVGDKGPVGEQGEKGLSGVQGAPGKDGVGNLVTTEWKRATWKYSHNNGNTRFFVADIPFKELTKEIISTSVILSHYNPQNAETPWELMPGMRITIGGRTLQFRSVQEGIGSFQLSANYAPNEDNNQILSVINNLNIELRLVVIKGNTKL